MIPSTVSAALISRWVGGYSGHINQSSWVDMHSANITYTDHAFQLWRNGHEALGNHMKIWRDSIPNFNLEAKSIWVEESLPEDKTKLVFKTTNTGTFENDLPQINATGKDFWFPGVVELIYDCNGLIETIDEYYTFIFDGVDSRESYPQAF